MNSVPEPSFTVSSDDLAGGVPCGNVTVGFAPTSPVTFKPLLAVLPVAEVPPWSVPQAAANNRGTAARTARRRRRIRYPSSRRQFAPHYPNPAYGRDKR
ncbi:hypothetical protein GCM10010466_01150 [Planomonospora alba]|uniref:Uncharacterized protein n=1 Tax=Planomonospora alba TaxID=161354 RepID=A0ABP6MJ27_9ACTN